MDKAGSAQTANQELKRTRRSTRILLITSIGFAFMPWILLLVFATLDLPLIGGELFNPMSLSAYIWLILTIAYISRSGSEKAWQLLLAFPFVFGVPIAGWLMRYAWATQQFGH